MTREIYLTIKQLLSDAVPELNHIDYYLGQFDQEGDIALVETPAALLKYNSIKWNTLQGNVQQGLFQFEIFLATDTRYGDERDITDTTHIDHLAIESKIFKALMNKRVKLSALPGFESLEGTENDSVLLESITRSASDPHITLNNLVITGQMFESVIYDYSAIPQWQTILASLECDIDFQN